MSAATRPAKSFMGSSLSRGSDKRRRVVHRRGIDVRPVPGSDVRHPRRRLFAQERHHPRLASSLLNSLADICAVHLKASARACRGPLRKRSLVAASACGPPLLRASTYPATAESSSSAGTALLIRLAWQRGRQEPVHPAATTRSRRGGSSVPGTPPRSLPAPPRPAPRRKRNARPAIATAKSHAADQSVAATGNVALHPRDGGFGAVQDAFEHRHQSAWP